jgi:hypothetical protein
MKRSCQKFFWLIKKTHAYRQLCLVSFMKPFFAPTKTPLFRHLSFTQGRTRICMPLSKTLCHPLSTMDLCVDAITSHIKLTSDLGFRVRLLMYNALSGVPKLFSAVHKPKAALTDRSVVFVWSVTLYIALLLADTLLRFFPSKMYRRIFFCKNKVICMIGFSFFAHRSSPGLPGGIFSNQKSPYW